MHAAGRAIRTKLPVTAMFKGSSSVVGLGRPGAAAGLRSGIPGSRAISLTGGAMSAAAAGVKVSFAACSSAHWQQRLPWALAQERGLFWGARASPEAVEGAAGVADATAHTCSTSSSGHQEAGGRAPPSGSSSSLDSIGASAGSVDYSTDSTDGEAAGTAPAPTLRLNAGGFMMPHPEKEEKGGEDAYFIDTNGQSLGACTDVMRCSHCCRLGCFGSSHAGCIA